MALPAGVFAASQVAVVAADWLSGSAPGTGSFRKLFRNLPVTQPLGRISIFKLPVILIKQLIHLKLGYVRLAKLNSV